MTTAELELELAPSKARAAVVHLDRLPPPESGYVRTAGGRARCNRNLTGRRVALTPELELVTCRTCRGTIAGDERPEWLDTALEQVYRSSVPAGARRRADLELRRRHLDEWRELLESELVLAALGGHR